MFPGGVLLTCIGVFFLSQREVADPSAKELIGHNSENINAPLLGSSSGGISGGRINEFEYEVVFNTQNLGFTVEPDIIHVAKNPKYSRVKRIVKVWKVKRVECTCGINAESHVETCDRPADDCGEANLPHSPDLCTPQTVTLVDEGNSPSRAYVRGRHSHDCAELKSLKRNHAIVGIDGDSLIKGNLSYYDVLRRIDNAPRPFKLRFRSSTPLPLDYSSTAAQFKQRVSALSPSRRTALGIGEVQIDEINSPSEKWAKSLTSTDFSPSQRHRSSLRVGLKYMEDEEETSREAVTRAHAALQGIVLNPLLDLIHTWNQSAPRAFNDGDISLGERQSTEDCDDYTYEAPLDTKSTPTPLAGPATSSSPPVSSGGIAGDNGKSPRQTNLHKGGSSFHGPGVSKAHPIASMVANISKWTPDWDKLGINKVLDQLTGIGREDAAAYERQTSHFSPEDYSSTSLRSRSISFSEGIHMDRDIAVATHEAHTAARAATVSRSSISIDAPGTSA